MSYRADKATASTISLTYEEQLSLCLKDSNLVLKANALNLAALSKFAYADADSLKTHFDNFAERAREDVQFERAPTFRSPFLVSISSPLYNRIKNEEGKSVHFYEAAFSTEFFYYYTAKQIVISIRGTQEKFPDFATDFDVAKTPFKEGVGMVHEGFYRAFHAIIEKIGGFLAENIPTREVIVTGHSLGGAVATILAAHIRRCFTSKVMLYTFGSPRVGNSEFVNHFTNVEPFPAFRFVHHKDLVSMIPLPGMDLHWYSLAIGAVTGGLLYIPLSFVDTSGTPYMHFGKLVFLKRYEDGTIRVDADKKTPAYIELTKQEFGNSLDDNKARIERLVQSHLDDHDLEHYISILTDDLHNSINAYLGNPADRQKQLTRIIAELKSRIAQLEAALANYEKNTPSGRERNSGLVNPAIGPELSHQAPADVLNNYHRTIDDKKQELAEYEDLLAQSDLPDSKERLLKSIIDVPFDEDIEREFHYQVS